MFQFTGSFGFVLWASHTWEPFKKTSWCAHWRKNLTQKKKKATGTEPGEFFMYLSSFVHSSCSLGGVREGGTETGTARTQGTMGCGCWCSAWASGSSRRRRTPLQSAASQWCRPQPLVHIPPPPRLGLPSHRCREEHSNSKSELWKLNSQEWWSYCSSWVAH